MIQTVEMYKAVCDNCGTDCDYGDFSSLSDKSTAKEWAQDADWYFTNDEKCYCRGCHSFDDNDNLVVNPVKGAKP